MEGGSSCLKYTLFVMNALFTLCGLGVVAVGVLAYTDQSEIKVLLEYASDNSGGVVGEVTQSQVAMFGIIGAGATLALVSMAGCLGAVTENKSLIVLYFSFLLLTLLVEVAAGILGFIFYDQAKEYVGKYVGTAILTKYGKPNNDMLTKAIDDIHQKLDCCGFISPNDWNNITSVPGVPMSCCKYRNSTDCNQNPKMIHNIGCLDALVNWVKDKILYVGAFAVAVAVVQIFGMAVSICLCKSWDEEDDVFYA